MCIRDSFYSYATLSQKFFDKKLQISVSCYNPFTKYQTYSLSLIHI